MISFLLSYSCSFASVDGLFPYSPAGYDVPAWNAVVRIRLKKGLCSGVLIDSRYETLQTANRYTNVTLYKYLIYKTIAEDKN